MVLPSSAPPFRRECPQSIGLILTQSLKWTQLISQKWHPFDSENSTLQGKFIGKCMSGNGTMTVRQSVGIVAAH